MCSSLPSLRIPSIRDSAVDVLRKALLDGRFQPGESLSEPAIASELGVSRGPVREALLVLEQEGLLVHHQNRGFMVLTLSPEDRRAMVQVRMPLEALALTLARSRVTPEELGELERLITCMVGSYGSDARSTAVDDLAFHSRLWELAGNPWLVVALRRVALPFFMLTIMYRSTNARLDTATYEQQHRNYVDFLTGRTELTAEECVARHLSSYEML